MYTYSQKLLIRLIIFIVPVINTIAVSAQNNTSSPSLHLSGRVIDKDDKVHQREIVVQHELEDIFVVKKGLAIDDKIVLEGVRQVHDGEKLEYEFVKPDEVMANQKKHAE